MLTPDGTTNVEVQDAPDDEVGRVGGGADQAGPPGGVISDEELTSAGLHGLRWVAMCRPVVEVVLFLSMVALTRLVRPAEFGRFAVALVFGELMLIPAQAVGVAFVQHRDTGPRFAESAQALALALGAVLIVFTLLMAQYFVDPVFGAQTAGLVRLTAIACALNSLCIVPTSVLNRRLEFRRLSINDLINTVVRTAASVTLAAIGWQAMGMMVGGLIGSLCATVQLWIYSRPPRPRFHREEARALSAYGTPAAFAAISWVGFRNCDYVIVGARLGARAAGYYFRAYTLGVEYQSKFAVVLNVVGFPLLARADSREGQRELRRRMVRLLTVIVFPALALLAVEAPVMVPWLFGPAWRPVVAPTQVLVVGGAVTLCINAVGSQLAAAGQVRAMMFYGWAHFLCYGATVFVVAPLGIFWVAVAAAVVHSLFLLVAYLLVRVDYESSPGRWLAAAVGELATDIGGATVSSLVLVAVGVAVANRMSAIHAPAIAHMAVVSVVGASAYLLTLRLVFPDLMRSSLAVVKRLVPRISPRLWLVRSRGRMGAA